MRPWRPQRRKGGRVGGEENVKTLLNKEGGCGRMRMTMPKKKEVQKSKRRKEDEILAFLSLSIYITN